MAIEQFMQQMKIKGEKKAKEMAILELSIWGNKHEVDLKKDFGFTDKKLSQRKKELQNIANG